MTIELERISVGGVWQYAARSENGGGGSPGLVTLTVGFAAIASAWSEFDTAATIELTDIPAGAVVLQSYRETNTLDNAVDEYGFMAYTSGAPSTDVLNNGDGPLFEPSLWTSQTYSDSNLAATNNTVRAKAGASLYMKFSGDDAPTEGVFTATLFILYP